MELMSSLTSKLENPFFGILFNTYFRRFLDYTDDHVTIKPKLTIAKLRETLNSPLETTLENQLTLYLGTTLRQTVVNKLEIMLS